MQYFLCKKCLAAAKPWATPFCFLEQGDAGEYGLLQLLNSENFYLYSETEKKS